MFVIKHKKIFFGVGLTLIIASLLAIFIWSLELSIEFTGGSIMEVEYPPNERPSKSMVVDALSGHFSSNVVTIQTSGDDGFTIRTPFLSEEIQGEVISSLEAISSSVEIERISSVGPTIGQELKRKSAWAIVSVIVAIILFIAFSFRKVSKPVSSWKYGIVAIVALVHDTIIPTAVFAVLGHYLGFQVDVLFITALLAILGYSVNDTIIVFDRIRENLQTNQEMGLKEDFGSVVGKSLSQTYRRSLNTSLTTLLVLLFLLFVGSDSTRHFALVMVIGIVAGTYSSLFLASPLLVVLGQRSSDK